MMRFRLLFILSLIFSCNWLYAKPLEIVFWHSLAGQLGQEVNKIANGFNTSQNQFVVNPVYKGDYIETLTGLAAAFRAGQPPDMVQIFEAGTRTMLSPTGVIKPVDELFLNRKQNLDKSSLFPAAREYYSVDGKLMAMPFNVSVPVMFYNADALTKVGYDDNNFPKTWEELEKLAVKLNQAGYCCVYTTTHPAWILLESFAAIHGLDMLGENGDRALYDNASLRHHLTRLRSWQKKHYFEYGGRSDDATILFTSGRCPLYSQSSGAYNSLVAMSSFRVGMASLPLDESISPIRFNNLTGGAAIWAINGLSARKYQGIAEFLSYLLRPDVQLNWHLNTGYLPLGTKGIYQSLPQLSNHPALTLGQIELMQKERHALHGNISVYNQIRQINDEEIEALFAGIKSPEKMLKDAVGRANHALMRFTRNTSSKGKRF